MPTKEVIRIVDELESAAERIQAVVNITTADELLELARHYNWDDGFEVPQAIVDHPACDRSVALHVFELAEGTSYLARPDDDWSYQEKWVLFCRTLAGRISGGHYPRVVVPFESELTTVQRYKLTKAGVPNIFFESIGPGADL